MESLSLGCGDPDRGNESQHGNGSSQSGVGLNAGFHSTAMVVGGQQSNVEIRGAADFFPMSIQLETTRLRFYTFSLV